MCNMIDLEKILKNTEIVEPKQDLVKKLEASKKNTRPLRIKLGFDPTAPDLHLGHAVVLKKLKDFQELGHTIVIVIGDYTARIGDPTGRNESRPPLNKDDVDRNAETYLNQLGLLIDLDKVEIVRNSQWFGNQRFVDAIGLSSQFTLAQILQRQDFRMRYEEGKPIHMHEIMYPMMQGQDSVEIKADIEIGGTDQVFNCFVGRDLQKSKGLDAQVVICMPLLPGTDGVEKMSKSKGNYIALTDKPENMYGKIMSIPDNLIPMYMNLLSNLSLKDQERYISQLEQNQVNPMDIKKLVAGEIVDQFHGDQATLRAAQAFERNVQQKNFDISELPQVVLDVSKNSSLSLIDLCVKTKNLVGLNMSKSHIRRLIVGGGVSVDDQKITDSNQIIYLQNDMVLKIGKRKLFLIKVQGSEPKNNHSKIQ